MSGQSAAESYPPPRRGLYFGGSDGVPATGVPSSGGEPDPGHRIRQSAPGPNRVRSVGTAQVHWPEYNRAVVLGTGALIVGSAVAWAVIEAVQR